MYQNTNYLFNRPWKLICKNWSSSFLNEFFKQLSVHFILVHSLGVSAVVTAKEYAGGKRKVFIKTLKLICVLTK